MHRPCAAPPWRCCGPAFHVTSLPVPLRKESKRGLIALALLSVVGLATFAVLATSNASRARAKDAIATRLKHAK